MSPGRIGCLAAVAAFLAVAVLALVLGPALDLTPRQVGFVTGRVGFHAAWMTGLVAWLLARRR